MNRELRVINTKSGLEVRETEIGIVVKYGGAEYWIVPRGDFLSLSVDVSLTLSPKAANAVSFKENWGEGA